MRLLRRLAGLEIVDPIARAEVFGDHVEGSFNIEVFAREYIKIALTRVVTEVTGYVRRFDQLRQGIACGFADFL